jgi:hypothetical protein
MTSCVPVRINEVAHLNTSTKAATARKPSQTLGANGVRDSLPDKSVVWRRIDQPLWGIVGDACTQPEGMGGDGLLVGLSARRYGVSGHGGRQDLLNTRNIGFLGLRVIPHVRSLGCAFSDLLLY